MDQSLKSDVVSNQSTNPIILKSQPQRNFQTDIVKNAENNAELEWRKGFFQKSMDHYEKALTQLDEFESMQSKNEKQQQKFIFDRIFLLNRIARTWNELTRYSNAIQPSIKSMELMKENNLTETLDYSYALACHANSLKGLNGFDNLTKALSESEEVISIREKVAGPKSSEFSKGIALKARVLQAMGRYDDAETLYLKSRTIIEENQLFDYEYAFILSSIGSIFGRRSKYANALELYQIALGILEREFGRNHPWTARVVNAIALVYDDQGKSKEAIELVLEARKTYEDTVGKQHLEFAIVTRRLAFIYERLYKTKEALDLFEESMKIQENLVGHVHVEVASTLNGIGVIHDKLGDPEKALEYFQQSREIYEKTVSKKHVNYSDALNNIGMVLDSMGRYDEALVIYEEGRVLTEQFLGKHCVAYSEILNNIGLIYSSKGQPQKALDIFLECKRIEENLIGTEHYDYASTLTNIALAEEDLGNYEGALQIYLRAREIFAKTNGKLHAHYADSCLNVGNVYTELGKNELALEFFNECREIEEKTIGKQHPNYTATLITIGKLLIFPLNRKKEAMKLFFEVASLNYSKPKPKEKIFEQIRKALWLLIDYENDEDEKNEQQTKTNENKETHQKRCMELDRNDCLALFSGDMRIYPANSNTTCRRWIQIGTQHSLVTTPLPNFVFDLKLAKDMVNASFQISKSHQATERSDLLILALSIGQRLISPDVPLTFNEKQNRFDFTKISQLNWKKVTPMLKIVRLLGSSTRKEMNFRQKSILICLLRTILDDPTSNQRHFQSILEFAKDRKTLGTKKKAFFFNFFVSSEKEQEFEWYVDAFGKLLNVSSQVCELYQDQKDFLSQFLSIEN